MILPMCWFVSIKACALAASCGANTLWMTVFVYLITIALSYVAHDIMVRTKTVAEPCRAGEAKDNKQWNIIDLEDMEVYR